RVDDLRLPPRLRHLRLELAPQVVGDRDDGARAADDGAGRGADARIGADVANVAAVRRDDERRPARERGDEAARDEEVGVDDVGPETAGRGDGAPRESEVPSLAAAPTVEDGALEDVSARGERLLEVADERSQIRVVRAGIHLRDEEDPHPAKLRLIRRDPVTD